MRRPRISYFFGVYKITLAKNTCYEFPQTVQIFLWPEKSKDNVAFFWSLGIHTMHNKSKPENNVAIVGDNIDKIKKGYSVLRKVKELTKRYGMTGRYHRIGDGVQWDWTMG